MSEKQESEHRKVPDWEWLTELLDEYDITEKRYPYTKNRKDFLSLEAKLYTEIQRRYKPRKNRHTSTKTVVMTARSE